MRFIKIVNFFYLLLIIVPSILMAQCDDDVDQIISVDDFPIELNGSTINSGDDFVVYTNDGNDTLAGYFTNDVIYKITIGFSDEDGDGENDDGINLFVDMCRNGVDFDASIAIIKSAGIDCKNIDGGLRLRFSGSNSLSN